MLRVLRDQVSDQWPEVETWLARGAGPRQAVAPFLPGAVRAAVLVGVLAARAVTDVVLVGLLAPELAVAPEREG